MKLRLNPIIIIMVLLMLAGLSYPVMSQCIYDVRDFDVTPEYGYLDFNYSARIGASGDRYDCHHSLAFGEFQMVLTIYDGDTLLREERSPIRRLNEEERTNKLSDPFNFGPYNFQRHFGVERTSNASYELTILRSGIEVAKISRKGPIVQPPVMQNVQFDEKLYFFEDLAVTVSFMDMPGLNPRAHLTISGPLNDDNTVNWNTGASSCIRQGDIYSCQISQPIASFPISSFRDGGDFSFFLNYNNLRMNIQEGPYDFMVVSYSPTIIEPIYIPDRLDYTDFIISAYVLDEGMKLIGGRPTGSVAELIISHPEKGSISYNNSHPRIEASYMIFEWDKEMIPFDKTDVDLSNPDKGGQDFVGRLVYHNSNWDYKSESEPLNFTVVEEIPRLDPPLKDQVVYVQSGQVTNKELIAIVSFSKGQGSMVLGLKGPELDTAQETAGTSLGGNRYRYNWQIPFDETHAGNNYTLSFDFLHPDLPGGAHMFDDIELSLRTISIVYSNESVSPISGLWNNSYTYEVTVDSSVESDTVLQIYDPCSREWRSLSSKPLLTGRSILNWEIRPFYQCSNIEGSNSMYRFKTSFAGIEYISNPPYFGPIIETDNNEHPPRDPDPRLVFIDYDPEISVREASKTYQKVRAQVESPLGQGDMRLGITGPDMHFEETSSGISMGSNRYTYSWSIPFMPENAGNHTISLYFVHPDLKDGGHTFPEGTMNVIVDYDAEEPQLVDLIYNPLILIEDDHISEQMIHAEVFSPAGQGELQLNLSGRGKLVVEKSRGADLGDGLYKYTWSVPFDRSNGGNEYKISLTYLLEGVSYSFGDRLMAVALKNDQIPEIWEPTLILEYDRTLYLPPDGQKDQNIRSTVNYSPGMGRLNINISGPGIHFIDSKEGRMLNGQRYVYEWTVPFNASHLDTSYVIALSYSHPSLPGGEYSFADRMMRVEPSLPTNITHSSRWINFSNPRVTPSHGSGITKYTYCVDIDTDLKEADIQLAIAKPNSRMFIPGNIVRYDGSNKTLCWPDTVINTNQGGNASYKFVSQAASSQAYEGPTVEPLNVSGSVEPYLGVVQGSQRDNDLYSFTYTARITDIGEHAVPWVELMVRPPNSSWRTVGEKKQYDPVKGKISWTVKPFGNESSFGDAEFKFKVDGLDTHIFKGPEIVAIYDEPSWIRSGANLYSYRAWFNSTEDLTIDLLYREYSDDSPGRNRANSSQNYEANSGRIIMTWPNLPAYRMFDFDIQISREG
ncbi:hypothetical protein [Candidatus Methanocrinis natronophilus]|uniref:Uncharacterized protein n=1 Tax=Candidatus Methanocrinis natronophilus TaxID=3033396 RepID=A0ABT5X4S4_9EURY|nr:hypothetical protein [Candidatus Methanocrinis natronophilus]MDF0589687.1 hypothetical protein [Candidatus Methanocrinis natronophilus]